MMKGPAAIIVASLLAAPLLAQSSGSSSASAKVVQGAPIEVQAAASAPKSAVSTYRISAGDQLEVYVWDDARLQRVIVVLPDGTFGFPLAGTIMAAGHTTNEVEAEVSRLLAPQYKNVAPAVTVSVKQATGLQIAVIGKVKGPGTFSPTRYLNVLDALALAGGPTEFADLGNIVILRNIGGKSKVVRVKLNTVLKGKPGETDLASDAIPELHAGDTVVVP